MARLVFVRVFEALMALLVCAGVARSGEISVLGGAAMPAYIQQFDQANINSLNLLHNFVDWEEFQTGGGTVCLGCNERLELTNFDSMTGVRLRAAQFVLYGDADVRIDFSVPAAGVGVGEYREVGLALEQAGNGIDLMAVAHVNQGGIRSYQSGGVVDGTTDVSGKLRVRRTGSAVISYYWDSVGEEWVQLDIQLAGYAGAMSFVIWTDESAVSGVEYTVGIDDIAVSYPADECSQAPLIGLGQPVLYDAFLSSTSALDPVFSCRLNGGFPSPGQGDSSQWYRFVAPAHPVTVYTCRSINQPFEFEDSLIAVYSGGCGGLVEIACGEDECGGFYSSVRLDDLVPGQQYWIQVCRHDADTWPDIILRIDPAVVYVDDDIPVVSGFNNGDSWQHAFYSLQDALDAIANGQKPGREEVWVAEGVYVPEASDRGPGGGRDMTFELPDGVVLRGGFPDDGTGTIENRDPSSYPTVLSGDSVGDDTRRGGIDINPGDPTINNSYHVVTVPETNGVFAIDGFVIERGNADGAAGTRDGSGGGMLVLGEVDVVDCTFRFNHGREGGAIGVESTLVGSRLTLDGCHLEHNTGEDGAALHVGTVGTSERVGNPLVIDSTTFIGNTVLGESGSVVRVHSGSFGVTVVDSDFLHNDVALGMVRSACLRIGAPPLGVGVPPATVDIDSCSFGWNTLTDPGVLIEPGFVGFHPALDIDIRDSTFIENTGLVRSGGGGAALGGVVRISGMEDTTCRMSTCAFRENSSGAGTVVLYGERTPYELERLLLLGNRLADVDGSPADEASPGIYANFATFGGGARSSLRLDNSLFVRNVDGASGAAIALRGEVDAGVYNVTIDSSIGDAVTARGVGGVLEMANSIVWGTYGGDSFVNDAVTPFAATLIACDLGGIDQVGGQAGVVLDRCFEAQPRFEIPSGNGTDGIPGTTDDTFGSHRLGPGSPCIDAGDSRYPDPELSGDFENNARYTDALAYADTGVGDGPLAVVDIGAYEAAGGIAAPCEGDPNGDGVVDVNDLSYVLFRLGDSGTPGQVDGDANSDGIVDVNDLSYILFRLGDPC